MNNGFIIAIDGPVASGKGTVAHKLSERLSGFDLYTGAMYRSLALFCLENNIDLSDKEAVKDALQHVTVDLIRTQVLLNGKDVTERIKETDAASMSALVSPFAFVRKAMVKRQQQIGEREIQKGRIVIAEGRDTGTVVFPKADLRLYLTASGEIRAKRRFEQYQRQGDTRSFEEVVREVKERDERDTTRETDPLASDPERLGYMVLDNSDMNETQTINAILEELKRRKLIDD